MNDADITVCGDDLLSVDTASVAAAQSLAQQLRSGGVWIEVVAGIDSVMVQFDAVQMDVQEAIDVLAAVDIDYGSALRDTGLIEIPVRYGGDAGPDLGDLCRTLELTPDEFIARHTADEHRVDMLGFTPGFAYVGGLDARLDVPRLSQPRQRVEAGSIGIAGGRTGIYALPGPGGWQIVGRTDLPLFDAAAEEPFALRPGMRVKFVAQKSAL